MAPPKAALAWRVVSGDFLGFNWNKVTWMSPYNNFYPITLSAGQGNRMLSNFLQYGHFHNRATYINLRNLIIGVPAFYATLCLVFMLDWYQFMLVHYIPLGIPMPEWAEKKHMEELVYKSWHKPGAMHKHHLGGAVSIPGTEQFITEM